MTKDKWMSVLRGAAIAAAGAILTYVSTQVLPDLQNSGDAMKLALAGGIGIAINIARKLLEKEAEDVATK